MNTHLLLKTLLSLKNKLSKMKITCPFPCDLKEDNSCCLFCKDTNSCLLSYKKLSEQNNVEFASFCYLLDAIENENVKQLLGAINPESGMRFEECPMLSHLLKIKKIRNFMVASAL